MSVPNIYVAGAYKSGSTHVALTLQRITGFRQAPIVATKGSIGDEEHRVDLPAANLLFPMGGFVFHNHIRGSVSNVDILRDFGIKPIVMCRNVLDSLVSIRNRFNEVSLAGGPEGWRAAPSKGWHMMPEEQQWRWLVYNVTPWQMAFLSSWQQANIPRLFIWYEDYFRDQVKHLRGILDFAGILELGQVSDEDLGLISDHKDGNFSSGQNAGTSGRGRKEIPEHWQKVIEDQAKAWGSKLYDEVLERGLCAA